MKDNMLIFAKMFLVQILVGLFLCSETTEVTKTTNMVSNNIKLHLRFGVETEMGHANQVSLIQNTMEEKQLPTQPVLDKNWSSWWVILENELFVDRWMLSSINKQLILKDDPPTRSVLVQNWLCWISRACSLSLRELQTELLSRKRETTCAREHLSFAFICTEICWQQSNADECEREEMLWDHVHSHRYFDSQTSPGSFPVSFVTCFLVSDFPPEAGEVMRFPDVWVKFPWHALIRKNTRGPVGQLAFQQHLDRYLYPEKPVTAGEASRSAPRGFVSLEIGHKALSWGRLQGSRHWKPWCSLGAMIFIV